MGFQFRWENEEKTIIRYQAEDPWNWNDYHKCVRASLFSLHGLDHLVHRIVDLSGSQSVPAGAIGHVRSFAKQQHPNQSAKVIVIGLEKRIISTLTGGASQLSVNDGMIYFVQDENEYRQLEI